MAHVTNSTTASPGADQWMKALLLFVFAYGGFETALAPMGEAKIRAATRRSHCSSRCWFAPQFTRSSNGSWSVLCPILCTARVLLPMSHVSRLVRSALRSLPSARWFVSTDISARKFSPCHECPLPKPSRGICPKFSPRCTALSHAVCFCSGIRDSSLGIRSNRRVQMERHSLRRCAAAILRRRLRRATRASTPATRRREVPSAGRQFLRRTRHLSVMVLVTRVDFGQSMIVMATVALALVNWAMVRNRADIAAAS